MRIPNNIVSELHNLNCEDVAQRFGLNPKGHKCRCFKHDDRIASLGFRQNHWKCFSCDVGGDAIALAQEYFSVSFNEACIILANEYGIKIPDVDRKTQKWRDSITMMRHRVQPNDTTFVFDKEIAECIMDNTILTDSGIEFLERQRKIYSDVVRDTNIHSLDNMNELRQLLVEKFGYERLVKVKVLKENIKYLTIDIPSLIIPYYDECGRLIGIQTRYLGEDNPDYHIPRFKRICCSPIRLYNLPVLNRVKSNGRIFITEGITDCLALLSKGYNAVAIPSATSFPMEDIAKLRRYNLYMIADNDRVGNEAFMKLYRTMLRYGCELKRVMLPHGFKDYCDYYMSIIK